MDHGVAPGAPGPQVPADTPLLDHSGAEHDPPRRLVAGRAGAPDALQFEAVESEAEQEVHRLRAEAPAPQVGAEREADLRAVRTLVNGQSRSPRNTVVVGRHGEHVHGPRVSLGVSDCALDDGAALLGRARGEGQVPDGLLVPVHPQQVFGVGGAELPQPEAVTGHIDTHVPSLTSCREGRDGVLTVRLDLAPHLRHCAVSVVLGLPQSTVDTHHTGDNARRTLLDRKSQNRGERLVGSLDLPLADPCETQVSPCPRLIPVSPNGSVSEALGEEITVHTPLERVRRLADARDIEWSPDWGPGKLVEHLFEELVEHTLIQPTFVRDFPLETSPLTRQHRDEPLLTEKWDLIGFGMELGTGFSELIDPVEQRRRLTEQSLLAAGGDPEAMQLDEDFLRALEYGMPPTAGVGIGIDRLLMAFTGKGIRETILFPLVKPTGN